MSFQLKEISTLEDFVKFTSVFWISYNNPLQPGFPCGAPIKTTVAAAIEDLVDRFSRSLTDDPTICYFVVTDTSTPENKVVGGGGWNVFLEDPYAEEPEPKNDRGVYWWPEGSDSRKFTERICMQRLLPRLERHRRPHVLLNMCFVLPEYRRRGVGSLIMNWGVKKADELQLDSFLESTDLGGALYRNFGFIEVDRTEVDMTISDPSEEWKDMEKQNLPMAWGNMWRPVGGKYIEGTKYPWQE